MAGIRPWPGHFVLAFDIDGTLAGYQGSITIDQIRRAWRQNVIPGILSSRPIASSLEVCRAIGFNAQFVRQCPVDNRAASLRQLANDIHRQFYIYVADREQDRLDALRAGWEHYYPWEFESLIGRIASTSYVPVPKKLADGCPLCHYAWRTTLYAETANWRVFDCIACGIPIIADREHNPNWDEQSRQAVIALAQALFPGRPIRWEMRQIKDHRHAHIGRFFGT
jgi:hypothetical protein